MQSLAEECTPLKKRYDACFNLWFEGYLQPALDAAAQAQRGAFPVIDDGSGSGAAASASASASGPSAAAKTAAGAEAGTEGARDEAGKPVKKPLITSWANSPVFRSYRHRDDAPLPAADDMVSSPHVHDAEELEPLDTLGMTRHEVKAAEYERRCGRAWRAYQGCLRAAIARNDNLTGLLNASQDEHPLLSLDNREGTPWDPARHGKDE